MAHSKKCRLLVIASISILLLAIFFQLLSLKVLSSLEVYYQVCMNIAILSVIITAGYIILSGEILKIQGIVLLLVYFLVGGHIVFRSFFEYKQTRGARHWQVDNSKRLTPKIGAALLSYESETGHFPDSNDWCDLVLKEDTDISKWHFNPSGRLNNSCGFVFNNNISELPVDDLAPSTVLIFEADGPWNFSGGPELFPGTRYRDQYFPWKERFAFIFLVDGTLLKYRLHDAAIAVFDEEDDKFGEFLLKNDPNYITIKWNESTNKRMLFEK